MTIAPSANATTYTGSESFDGASVGVSITTDGVSGTVAGSDITSWSISITDGAGTIDMTPTNSGVLVTGTSLAASPTELTFNFGAGGGQFVIESPTIGSSGPFWCVTAVGDCFPGQVSATSIGVSTQTGESPLEQISESGVFCVGSVAGCGATATPLPSSWVMFLGGLIFAGFVLYRTSNKAAPVLAA
jgi:hypothetical protein